MKSKKDRKKPMIAKSMKQYNIKVFIDLRMGCVGIGEGRREEQF